jgi:hypothetical protein
MAMDADCGIDQRVVLPRLTEPMKSEPGPPLTIGNAAKALRLRTEAAGHVEPDLTELVEQHGPCAGPLDWRSCSRLLRYRPLASL